MIKLPLDIENEMSKSPQSTLPIYFQVKALMELCNKSRGACITGDIQ